MPGDRGASLALRAASTFTSPITSSSISRVTPPGRKITGGTVVRSKTVGVESTVLDLTTVPPVILRPGGVTREMLEEVIGEVKVDAALKASDAPRSPGMKYTHYSPQGETFLVTEHGKNLARKLDILLKV